jgi:hypothetical protein
MVAENVLWGPPGPAVTNEEEGREEDADDPVFAACNPPGAFPSALGRAVRVAMMSWN